MISVKESQDLELDIMHKLHDYCVKHGLRYLLAYGTLIGAVRHKGFIPWDNDIDIFMPRPDFERFLEMTKTDPVAEDLYVTHYTLDENYFYNCARVCDERTEVEIPYIPVQPSRMGIWVDIFAVDGVPDSEFLVKAHRVRIRTLYYALRAHIYGTLDNKNQFRKIVKLACLKFLSNKDHKLNRRITALEKQYPYDDYQNAALWCLTSLVPIPKKDFEAPVSAPFEQYSFFIPEDYDRILRDTYGDYMKLPPESKRIPHQIRAFWK